MAVVCCVLIGISVGQERWPFVAALAAIPVLLLWPAQSALGAFGLLVLFESGAVTETGGGKTLGWFVGAAAACTLLVTALAGRRLQKPPKAAWWWTMLIVWSAFTVLWAVDSRIVTQRLPTAVALLLLFLAAASLRVEESEFQPVVAILILGGFLVAAYAVYQFYHGVGWTGFGLRASLVIDRVAVNPDIFATRLLLPLSLALGAFFMLRSRVLKLGVLGIMGVLLLAVLLTQSRAALLAVLVAAGVFVFRLGANRRILVVGAVLAIVLMFVPSQFFFRVHQAAATGGAGRLDIWRVGVELLKHFWILGAGLSNFPVAYSRYAGYAPIFRGYGRGAHNLYLQVAVELGLVGLVLMLQAVRSQLWWKSKSGVKPHMWLVACEAAGWSLLVSSTFADLMWEKTFWLTWIMLAISTQVYSKQLQQVEPISVRRIGR